MTCRYYLNVLIFSFFIQVLKLLLLLNYITTIVLYHIILVSIYYSGINIFIKYIYVLYFKLELISVNKDLNGKSN